jgi:hypothetical protein
VERVLTVNNTTMDYKKKYEDALERAKKNYKTAQDYLCEGSQIGVECLKNTLTTIFPELAESEDERIRKWLIAQLKIKIGDNATLNNMIYKALAWIEKQGEQKPQRIISAEAKEALYSKPTWSEEDDIHQRDAIYAAENIYTDKCGKEELVNWLKTLKQRIGE